MSHTHTIDDIWKLFQETNRLFQKSKRKAEQAAERRQQEAERRQQEAERRQQEAEQAAERRQQEAERRQQDAEQAAERRRQEAERRQQEAEQAAERRRQDFEREMQEKRADTEARIQESERIVQETDRVVQETGRIVQETSRKVKEVSTLIGNLGGRWGEFVEGLVAPACLAMFAERQIPVDEIWPRIKKTIAGEQMEIDLLVANTVAAVLVEVKSNLTVEDVHTHLDRLARFKSFFPRYASCQVYGAVAGIAIDQGADRFAINRGLFVIVQSGESVRLANEETFVPRTW